jgi:hypothetical protein
MIRRKINQLWTIFLSYCIKHKFYSPLVLVVLLSIKERSHNGRDRFFFSRPKNKITILALDSNRYRGDLDALAKNKKFRVLHMTQRVPGWLIQAFYKDNMLKKYINSKKGSDENICHNNALKFTTDFLQYFYSFVSVDCVTSVNFRYIEDYNWSKASSIIGVPFIILYRECMITFERIYDEIFFRLKDRFGKFHGDHVIVHNQITKKLFINSGYCNEKNITVGGALRMDKFLEDIKKNSTVNKKNKIFTLFYFPHTLSLFGREGKYGSKEEYQYHSKEWDKRDALFEDLHSCIIELAESNPEIDFIIKPKLEMVSNETWVFYENIVRKSNIDVSRLSNYKVLPEADVHELIIKSDVICALQSSTALESAVAKKRVIFPLFYQFLDTPYLNNFPWSKHLNLFDVAKDKSDFKRLFYEILNQPHVDKHVISERIDLFETYFDSYDGVAFDKYSKVIESVVDNKKILGNKVINI